LIAGVQRWQALEHITASPRKIGSIVQAALVLTPGPDTDNHPDRPDRKEAKA
jgi:hypothetical protein